MHTSVINAILPSSVFSFVRVSLPKNSVVLAHRQKTQRSNEWQQQQRAQSHASEMRIFEKRKKTSFRRSSVVSLPICGSETATVCQSQRKSLPFANSMIPFLHCLLRSASCHLNIRRCANGFRSFSKIRESEKRKQNLNCVSRERRSNSCRKFLFTVN